MHIPDGMLTWPVCAAGYGISGAMMIASIKKIYKKEDPKEEIPKVSLVTAAFFAASLIHIPIPPSSVHLVLSGLLGILLKEYTYLSVMIGLFFQAMMFSHGGISTLGINGVIIGIPAVVISILYHTFKDHAKTSFKRHVLGFLGGSMAIGLSVGIFSLVVILGLPPEVDKQAEKVAVIMSILAHIPIMILEGIFTAWVLGYIKKVKPNLLGVSDHNE